MPSPLTVALCLMLFLAGCVQQPTSPAAVPVAGAELPEDDHVNPPITGVRQLMRAKLAHAQAVLEGITMNRMDLVEMNALALVRLSELTEWQVHRTMEYTMFSDDFRWNAKELARHAKERKVHAATLDYMQLTMNCVRCHDYMNQAGLVKIDLQSFFAASR